MDYFNNVFTNFLGHERLVALLSIQGQKALAFIKNILICVLKKNEGLTGLDDMRVSN